MKKPLWLLLLFCLACTSTPKAPSVHISMADSSRSLKFTGFDNAIVSEVSRESVPEAWQSLLPVYRMPADTDLKDYQPVQPGAYRVKDGAIIFTPDTPFQKGKAYFARCYDYSDANGVWDFIRNRKKLRSKRYTDLVFLSR